MFLSNYLNRVYFTLGLVNFTLGLVSDGKWVGPLMGRVWPGPLKLGWIGEHRVMVSRSNLLYVFTFSFYILLIIHLFLIMRKTNKAISVVARPHKRNQLKKYDKHYKKSVQDKQTKKPKATTCFIPFKPKFVSL